MTSGRVQVGIDQKAQVSGGSGFVHILVLRLILFDTLLFTLILLRGRSGEVQSLLCTLKHSISGKIDSCAANNF